jgi:hypothetical protein
MRDQRSKVLSFRPFELSIRNRLLTNVAKVVPLGAHRDMRNWLLRSANLTT